MATCSSCRPSYAKMRSATFTRNDMQKRWANGTLAKVVKLTDDEIRVALNNGDIVFYLAQLRSLY